ncbi:MAG TPA: SDR family oxidoreductase [Solirubrobacteraceae bacterium]|jgi:3-oxoacyl-[acyl-carrier protein] reductase|nr:SDR family oxidoreductase [Solirubrobacteraceae bacterium]
MDLGLRDRACIVTGATGGIGRAVAVSLAGEGAAVVLLGRRSDVLADVARACEDAGGRGEPLELDVTAVDAGERAVEACLDRFGRIDALVNGAGTSAVRSVEELTDDEWQAQWALHVMAPMRLMRAAAPAMAERGWGRIVNVASSSGKRPSSTNMAYSVTKAAELSLSRAFADIWAARGVLVNSVSPGPIGGDLWLSEGGLADQNARVRGMTREEVLESTAARQPIGRLGTEEEIAAVIVFLCSEPASNVAGASWSVDGGAVPVII